MITYYLQYADEKRLKYKYIVFSTNNQLTAKYFINKNFADINTIMSKRHNMVYDNTIYLDTAKRTVKKALLLDQIPSTGLRVKYGNVLGILSTSIDGLAEEYIELNSRLKEIEKDIKKICKSNNVLINSKDCPGIYGTKYGAIYSKVTTTRAGYKELYEGLVKYLKTSGSLFGFKLNSIQNILDWTNKQREKSEQPHPSTDIRLEIFEIKDVKEYESKVW